MRPAHAEHGMVLLSVMVMLMLASAWATSGWRQVFWQQRMQHSQALELMAGYAAEAGALAIHQRLVHHAALHPERPMIEALAEPLPAQRLPGALIRDWSIHALTPIDRPPPEPPRLRIAIVAVVRPASDPWSQAPPIAQAQWLIDVEDHATGPRITRWQRVYPR